MAKLELQAWNYQVLMLSQALQGAISPNFRKVSLGHDGRRWLLRFVLQQNYSEDLEEIEDIVSQFEAFQNEQISLSVEVEITADSSLPDVSPDRVVFRRREP